jgi:NAD(P)-dependent dehydrogenase (short-subunit alcohol dehydrogenase family)
MERIAGLNVLVFGASSGIGRATAHAFAEAGAHVTAAARRMPELEDLAAECGARAVSCDVTDRASVDAAVATASAGGRLDVVINTAGLNIKDRRLDVLTGETWERMIATNLTGAFHTLQASLPVMRACGGGLIVQVSSSSGKWGDQSGAAYQAAKSGIIGLCQATMAEERHNGIRATALMPGLVDTPFPLHRPTPPDASTLAKAMQPEDVALACLFLAQLPLRAYVPELALLPGALQVVGMTSA